jgi:hypothetical protein
MLHARCDESYPGGDPNAAAIYVVAGFLGHEEQWQFFDELGREDMKALGIQAHGLHASKCAVGGTPYKHLTSHQRYEIQYRMIVDIAAAKLYGCAAVSDQAHYASRRKLFDNYLGPKHKKFNEPHVLTTKQCINLMLLSTEEKTTEPLTMVVDRNSAFGGRVEEWYKLDVVNTKLDDPAMMGPNYRSRLGGLSRGSRTETLGLQAADLLAYVSLRHALHERGVGKQPWQWQDLTSAVKVRYFTFGEDYWQEMEDSVKAAAEKPTIA